MRRHKKVSLDNTAKTMPDGIDWIHIPMHEKLGATPLTVNYRISGTEKSATYVIDGSPANTVWTDVNNMYTPDGTDDLIRLDDAATPSSAEAEIQSILSPIDGGKTLLVFPFYTPSHVDDADTQLFSFGNLGTADHGYGVVLYSTAVPQLILGLIAGVDGGAKDSPTGGANWITVTETAGVTTTLWAEFNWDALSQSRLNVTGTLTGGGVTSSMPDHVMPNSFPASRRILVGGKWAGGLTTLMNGGTTNVMSMHDFWAFKIPAGSAISDTQLESLLNQIEDNPYEVPGL